MLAVRGFRLGSRIALLVSSFLTVSSPPVEGAPVTLAFEAEITEVIKTNPIDMSIPFDVGNSISGKILFTPIAASPGPSGTAEDQVGVLTFEYLGHVLTTDHFALRVVDNVDVDSSVSPLGSIDVIGVRCSSHIAPTSCHPIEFEFEGVTYDVEFDVSLIGDIDSLANGQEISTPLAWNALDVSREVTLVFRNEMGGYISVRANIGDFSSIPEPRLLAPWLACFVLAGVSVYRHLSRKEF